MYKDKIYGIPSFSTYCIGRAAIFRRQELFQKRKYNFLATNIKRFYIYKH